MQKDTVTQWALYTVLGRIGSCGLPIRETIYTCKELPNKDHGMCGKERFIRNQTTGLSLSGSECSSLAEMGSGLYRRGQAMGEGESLWSLIICDHQMEQVDMPG
jgi:hypothetical protein